ncbi:MAG: hypothetical protein ASARMPREDX12_009289 [Alectoria sarmentosa]|nr:MAG: hypothetical protein ASARMPREDX12_009289 [Alectoria sarmentosa]
MSSTTSCIPTGDPDHGCPLFKLPREIRDEIYRLLVKGRYLADKPTAQHDCLYNECSDSDSYHIEPSNSEPSVRDFFDRQSNVNTKGGLHLSVLRVSKVISREAQEVLYSESNFRFFINIHDFFVRGDDIAIGRLDRLKRVAPVMRNVDLDFCGWSMAEVDGYQIYAEILERSLGVIDLFGGTDIKRQKLHIRILSCSTFLLKGTSLNAICQRLKALFGFRVATVEVMLTGDLLVDPVYFGFDKTDPSSDARDLVYRITQAVTEQLEPAFGPAISSFKSDADNVHIPETDLCCLAETNLIGFLEFHPGKRSVQKFANEEDKLPRGV